MLTMRPLKQVIKGAMLITFLSMFYNEFLLYYMTLYKCNYPNIVGENRSGSILEAMLVADTHLLGSRNGHWFDKLRREWQMHRAFQTAQTYFNPEAVFFLGDIFDEGKWCSQEEFDRYVLRFHDLFYVSKGTKVFVLEGNHDIGFHYASYPALRRRFQKAFNTKPVRKVRLKGIDFVMINSMAFHADGCSLCQDAERRLNKISSNLSCVDSGVSAAAAGGSDGPRAGVDTCSNRASVVLSHFPLYRESDEMCDELDEAPEIEKFSRFREKWECISNASTAQIKSKLRPRIVFSGHTHHGCRTDHADFTEWTVSSFSWRNKKNPAFLLARFSSDGGVAVSKCMMPDENHVFIVYTISSAFILVLFVKFKTRS